MPNGAIIDISELPKDAREAVIEVAKKHNYLTGKVVFAFDDLRGISGATPEEKDTFHKVMGAVIRPLFHVIVNKGLLYLFWVWLALGIAKACGFDTRQIAYWLGQIVGG